MRYEEFADTNILTQAYDIYRRNGLVISQRAFSRRILGQSNTYYSCMITRNRKPSRKVLETLLSVTKTIIATFIGNPHLHKPYAQRLNTAYKELEELIAVLAVEMDLNNVVETVSS